MMVDTALREIPGGQALIGWFGCVPHFHGAELRNFSLNRDGVTITLDAVSDVSLSGFDLAGGIFDLQVKNKEEGYELTWTGVFGDQASRQAKHVRLDLYPETS